MRIQLSDHFTYKKLFRFVAPSIIMMIFTSIYGVVDGLFVSNFVGKTPFAAINLIMPFLMGIGTIGFMIGTGGSVLVAKTLGEGDKTKSNQLFSMLIFMTIISAITLSIIGIFLLPTVASAMGATGQLFDDCIIYGRIMLIGQTANMLQIIFQSLFSVAEKPNHGLAFTVGAGVANIVLDALFIAVFQWGLVGAVLATIISQVVGGIGPLFYFARKNSSLLRIVKPTFRVADMLKVCTNGASGMLTNISSSIISVLYNLQLMKIAGEDGIAAYGVIMYVNFIFIAIFIGFSIGSAPIVGYHYGAENHQELKSLLRKGLTLMGIFGVILTILAQVAAAPLSRIFVGYDADLLTMTTHAFRLFSLSFVLCGFNVFGAGFFTSLNSGLIAASLSFIRTLIFPAIAVFVLPIILGINGIWLAVTVAELLALLFTVGSLITQRKKYHYS
ncbi:MAG: MATE family efflux transporter [Suipraeoptans sp.]